MKNYQKIEFKNGSELHVPESDIEEDRFDCECHCHDIFIAGSHSWKNCNCEVKTCSHCQQPEQPQESFLGDFAIQEHDTATVVSIYGNGELYQLEFFDTQGKTKGLKTMTGVIEENKRIASLVDRAYDDAQEYIKQSNQPDQPQKRVLCITCHKPIHADEYGGECKEGSFHKACQPRESTMDLRSHVKHMLLLSWANGGDAQKQGYDKAEEDRLLEELVNSVMSKFDKSMSSKQKRLAQKIEGMKENAPEAGDMFSEGMYSGYLSAIDDVLELLNAEEENV